ncbi:hypothetical protein [Azohydromonas caseinilytica]|uniref:Uncharacterized protein n=1 Tax=Azohydromonas caseinilytica TaxID=2728836 RepID=A0A848FEB7_9BURK|nr:hypothetical protein [Azohydromonas caseinilytica]NML16241.1 hypothetical protein [Azohydromonas caseinilytica]
MEIIAAFVDDAAQALRVLKPLSGPGTHWVLVGCAPKLTHRVSKWVSHSSREQWRTRWAAQLFAELRPQLPAGRIDTLLARQPLSEVAQQLQQRHGRGLRMIDARRQRLGHAGEPLPTELVDTPAPDRWTAPIAITSGLTLLLSLSD